MSIADENYDIAISFSKYDMGLAREINNTIIKSGIEQSRIFFYPEHKESTGGIKGAEEAFKNVFLKQSKIVVLVYSGSWGKSKICKKEKEGILERNKKDSRNWLSIIVYNSRARPPKELVEHRMYLNFTEYTIEQMATTILKRLNDCEINMKIKSIPKNTKISHDSLCRQLNEFSLIEAAAYLSGIYPHDIKFKEGSTVEQPLFCDSEIEAGYKIILEAIGYSTLKKIPLPINKIKAAIDFINQNKYVMIDLHGRLIKNGDQVTHEAFSTNVMLKFQVSRGDAMQIMGVPVFTQNLPGNAIVPRDLIVDYLEFKGICNDFFNTA